MVTLLQVSTPKPLHFITLILSHYLLFKETLIYIYIYIYVYIYIYTHRYVNKVRELYCRRIVHYEFVATGQTVNQVYYLEVLKRLREKVRRKRPELFDNNSWFLHDDNAPAHTALSVREFLATKQITVMYVCPCIIYEIEERYPLDATIYLLL